MPTASSPVVDIAADTMLDDTLANGAMLVCSQPVTLRPAFADLRSDFVCTVLNHSNGDVTFAPGTSSSGDPLIIPPGQSAELRAFTYTGGNILFAQLAAPGQVIGLTAVGTGLNSIMLSWQPPSDDVAVTSYIVNYRITDAGSSWTSQNTAETSLTVSGLAPTTQYDFEVIATNAAGDGPPSWIVTAATAPAGNYLLTTGFFPILGSTWSSTAGGIVVNVGDNSAPVDGGHGIPAGVAFAWSLTNSVPPTTGLTDGMQFNIDAHKYWGAYLTGPGSSGNYFLWAIAKDTNGTVVQSLCWPSTFSFT